MKERPILFSTSMVQAILSGRKTQTRRVIKPQPTGQFEGRVIASTNAYVGKVNFDGEYYNCPYGKPGDRLWVRETWSCIGAEYIKPSDIAPGYTVRYKADEYSDNWRVEKWRPSIFMPRWASRITLTVTDVRVERVQDITEDGAMCEGVRCTLAGETFYPAHWVFRSLWDSINLRRGYGWSTNPWVWVVEFEVAE